MSPPALLIAAARSGSGKTTLALGLMRALARRGLRVSAVKCGPDYIDPAFHTAATGRPSLNLDSWAMSADLIQDIVQSAQENADIIIAEGAMGLFDGAPQGASGIGASADIAQVLGWPVLLIHDISGQAQTAAALLRGLVAHDPKLTFAGVVLNRCSSPRHRNLVSGEIAKISLPILGVFPKDETQILPERHLGLVQAAETDNLEHRLNRLADFVEKHINIEELIRLSKPSNAYAKSEESYKLSPPAQRIAIARDEAFSFLYPHVTQAWRKAGAELYFFSPLANQQPPKDCDLCWLPGGYPELHAQKLAQADLFLQGVRNFAQTRPVHGECGGFMVLGKTLTDASGATAPMLGLLELETSFAKRKLHLGYRQARLATDHCLGKATRLLRGHEFHYATITKEEGAPFAFVRDAYESEEKPAGLRAGHVSGSFFHVIA